MINQKQLNQILYELTGCAEELKAHLSQHRTVNKNTY